MRGHKVRIERRSNGGSGFGSALAICECGWVDSQARPSAETARVMHSNHKWDVKEARKLASLIISQA